MQEKQPSVITYESPVSYRETIYAPAPCANYGVTVWYEGVYVALEAGGLYSNIAVYRSYAETI